MRRPAQVIRKRTPRLLPAPGIQFVATVAPEGDALDILI